MRSEGQSVVMCGRGIMDERLIKYLAWRAVDGGE